MILSALRDILFAGLRNAGPRPTAMLLLTPPLSLVLGLVVSVRPLRLPGSKTS